MSIIDPTRDAVKPTIIPAGPITAMDRKRAAYFGLTIAEAAPTIETVPAPAANPRDAWPDWTDERWTTTEDAPERDPAEVEPGPVDLTSAPPYGMRWELITPFVAVLESTAPTKTIARRGVPIVTEKFPTIFRAGRSRKRSFSSSPKALRPGHAISEGSGSHKPLSNHPSRISPSETDFEKTNHGGTGASDQVRCFFLCCYRNPALCSICGCSQMGWKRSMRQEKCPQSRWPKDEP